VASRELGSQFENSSQFSASVESVVAPYPRTELLVEGKSGSPNDPLHGGNRGRLCACFI